MFQAWLVKRAKTQASSAPNTLTGDTDKKKTTVMEMKLRIGTDCRMSSRGMSRLPARALFAARVA